MIEGRKFAWRLGIGGGVFCAGVYVFFDALFLWRQLKLLRNGFPTTATITERVIPGEQGSLYYINYSYTGPYGELQEKIIAMSKVQYESFESMEHFTVLINPRKPTEYEAYFLMKSVEIEGAPPHTNLV